MLLLLFIAVGLTVGLYALKRMRPPMLPANSLAVEFTDHQTGNRFRLSGPFFQNRFRRWLQTAEMSSTSSLRLEKVYEVDLNVLGHPSPILIFVELDSADSNDVWIQWQGSFWRGDLREFKEIVALDRSVEPDGVGYSNWQNWTGYYFDDDGDGMIDRKSVNLSADQQLVWSDSDGDGFFDDGHILQLGVRQKRHDLNFQIAVPRIEREPAADPISQ